MRYPSEAAPPTSRARREDRPRSQGPRRRLGQGQERRPGHQGLEGQADDAPRLRGRPDAAPASPAQAARVQPPEQGPLVGRQPRPARRRVPQGRQRRPRRPGPGWSGPQEHPGEDPRGRGAVRTPAGAGARLLVHRRREDRRRRRHRRGRLGGRVGMLSAFRNAFKVPDLRGKIFFTVAMIAVYRLGSYLPVPGVDFKAVHDFLNSAGAQNNSAFTLINLFSGGALTQFAVFALGIMPYITSSIIMQLLGVVIPRLEQLQKEGEQGRKKIQQYTRYVTVGLAILQSAGIVQLAHNKGILPLDIFPGLTWQRFTLAVLTLTAGTALIMWLGELITQRGVGNGMSILIFTAIVARLPSEGASILRVNKGFVFGLVCLLGLLIIVAVIFVEQAQRRIPVTYAKRMVGRPMYGGQSTYIPLKVNQAGVIPIIF